MATWSWKMLAAFALTTALLLPVTAGAQVGAATRPAISATDVNARKDMSDFESRPLGSSTGGTSTTSPTAAALEARNTTSARSIGFDLGRMAIALMIVLAMIFSARWLFTHFFAGARAPATSKAVKVLGRTSLAPRQQILLLQVGRRVVVVGESNGQLATLANLDDPDEVASLVGQLQEEQIQRAASFGGLFGRAQRKLDAEDEHTAPIEVGDLDTTPPPQRGPLDPAATEDVKSELSGLLDKVRSIRNQLGR